MVEEDLVREHLAKKINAHKSMGPNGMHPNVLGEAIAEMLSSLKTLGKWERCLKTGG